MIKCTQLCKKYEENLEVLHLGTHQKEMLEELSIMKYTASFEEVTPELNL